MSPHLRSLALAALVATPAVLAQRAGDVIPDDYIVTVQPGVDASSVALGHGVGPRHVYGSALNGFAGFIPPGRVRALAADPRVISVVPNRLVTIGARPGGGGGGGGTSDVVPEGVKRVGAVTAWTSGFTGAGVGVAILDTGIDLGHADLAPVLDGFNAINPSAVAMDDNGHGTHVAGTVAALKNNQGVVGVAHGASLYAVKVLNAQGSGSDAEVIAGLDWVRQHASSIRVANMSLGRPAVDAFTDGPMHTAIKNLVTAGVTVVVSAGNDCVAEVSELVPAGFAEVIAVASTTAKAGTSAYSNIKVPADMASYFTTDGVGVAISAPGEDQENVIKGYRLQSVGILSLKLGGGTTRMAGTSMAAPHVTGVAALVCQKYPGITPDQVRQRLTASPTPGGTAPSDGITTCYTFDGVREGVVDAARAL